MTGSAAEADGLERAVREEGASPVAPQGPPARSRRPLSREGKEWIGLGITLVAVFAVLALVSRGEAGVSYNYLLGVVLTFLLYSLFTLGLSIEFSYAGLINFGIAAFIGVGAYSVGLLHSPIHIPHDPDGLTRVLVAWAPDSLRGRDLVLASVLEPAFTGTTVGGFVICVVAAGIAALLAALPVHLLLHSRSPSFPMRPRTRTAASAGLAIGVFAAAFASLFPLGIEGARNAVVLVGLLGAVAFACLFALLLGLPTLRLREDYLAIVTIGAAEILRSIWVNEEWLTQGTLGIQRLVRPIVDWSLDQAWLRDFVVNTLGEPPGMRVYIAHTAVVLLVVLYVLFVFEVLARSPWGRVLRAIREDEDVAASLGKDVLRYKMQALMLGSVVAALGGVFLAWHLSNVYPDHFIPAVTFFTWIMLVVGGIGTHRGALAGAAIVLGLFELAAALPGLANLGLKDLAGPPQAIFTGVLLVLIMMFRPQGILGRKEEMLYGK